MNNYLNKLAFNEIIEKLKNYCNTYIGKDIASLLVPSNKKDVVKNSLEETNEAMSLALRASFPNFMEIKPIDVSLKRLASGLTLTSSQLLNLKNIFQLASNLKNYINQDFLEESYYPLLFNLFNKLYSNKSVIDSVNNAIIDENTINDKASKNLYDIRRKKRKLEQNIKEELNKLLRSKYVQESIITIRNDRFVIPVKEEYRSLVKGFVHDISNAGSTVFIEPLSVFEMNNELNELSAKEELEIEKILQELSNLFSPYYEELKLDINLIGKLDFIFAKAKFAKDLNANIPHINDKKEINLVNARHPLIAKDSVVPISLSLGTEFQVLLITGPNTGGKTVTLKTVGLLSCMACSGLAIPADAKSSIYVFDKIFTDIGDDQSISDSLSTFSSHMKNIVHIVNNATENSLILVDELGSGTDPIEGANLAISILDYLKSLGSLIIATTHYQELKKYALVTDGFENASVEFDVATLTPTYRLLVGVPGKSNAFEISKNLGLSDLIIKKAKSLLSNQEINIEDLLKNIYNTKTELEQEKQEIDKKLKEVSDLEKSLREDRSSLKESEENIINKAKIEARNILLDAKEEASEIIRQMNLMSNDIKNADNMRNKLNKKLKSINIKSDAIFLDADLDSSNTKTLSKEDIKPNMEVFVRSLGKTGTIISNVSRSNEVQVQIGLIKMNLPISDLEKAHNTSGTDQKGKKNISKNSNYTSISKSKTAKSEINVIGLNVEEAIFVVDKFLDDCSLARLQTVRIVHGKGTGKLRTGIHQFLKKHPQVKSYRMGTYGEGEMGVTVVELK